ncbi:MAG: hypothetical protein HFH46_03705 [Bacilli bacterium]|nr:hypothetical protein [Bacilli bacterium]
MGNKIPKVFANPVSKEIGNNKNVFYSSKEPVLNDNNGGDNESSKLSNRSLVNNTVEKNINQKINGIFSSSRYVYKADVEITLKNGVVTKRIIGKNANHLITIDNELIPISDIVDIKHK